MFSAGRLASMAQLFADAVVVGLAVLAVVEVKVARMRGIGARPQHRREIAASRQAQRTQSPAFGVIQLFPDQQGAFVLEGKARDVDSIALGMLADLGGARPDPIAANEAGAGRDCRQWRTQASAQQRKRNFARPLAQQPAKAAGKQRRLRKCHRLAVDFH